MRPFILNAIVFFYPFLNKLEAQPNASIFKDIIITRDTAICPGESVVVKSVSLDNYSWSPTEGLSDPHFSSPIATPLKNTIYYLFSTARGKT